MKYFVFYFGYTFLLSVYYVCGKGTLEHKLRTWEVLTDDDIAIGRGRRSADGKHYTYDKEVTFSAFERQFTLSLLVSPEIFAPNFKAYVHGEKGPRVIDLDKMSMYKGTVLGEPKSVVHAHMQDGQMIANIKTEDDTYVIEPSWRHLPEHEELNDNKARMIIYRQSDVNLTALENHKNSSPCAVDDLMKEMREREQMLENSTQSKSVKMHHRPKRAVGNPKICTLELVADHRFFMNMGGRNTLETMYYLITLIERVNTIFKKTDWGEEEVKGQYLGYGFQISSITVHDKDTRWPSYNTVGDSWDARDLLREFSEIERTACLAHLFTYLDFPKGVLGLAYVGSSRDVAAGGICSGKYDQGVGKKSLYLNTGLTTTKNWGSRILTIEADLVTTHELGHNFGAEHDNGEMPECTPGESHGGNYIMYPAAVNGLYDNNRLFSKCSKHNVFPVIKKRSSECFVEDKKAFCGNYQLEPGEQCDAGYLQEDECCDRDCKLRPGKQCSRKTSPCCINCQVASNTTICYSEIKGSCYNNTYCDGKKFECPAHVPKYDGTPCGDSGQCKDGQCQPFCAKVGLKPCLCTRRKENMCKRCCAPQNATGENLVKLCVPYKSETLRDNARCSLGYCNKTECIKQTQDVIERVWSIFEKIAPDQIGEFLADNIVGAVLVFSLLIWIPFGCLVNFVDKRREEHRRKEEEWFAERMSDVYRMNPQGGNFGSVTTLHLTQKATATKAGLNSKKQWAAAKDKGSAMRKSQEGLDEIADDDIPTTSARLNMGRQEDFQIGRVVDVHTAQDRFLSPDDDSPPISDLMSRRTSRPQLRRQDHTTVAESP